ncbi:recombinase family protein [Streptomyces qaidamensis]|uniref:recombinase family protein n=1 Tax=Streptomyces qaidamensis TaxID=1783515 RepID=UPI0036E3EBB1
MARVLGVIRLSRGTDETTSPERQRLAIQKWADRDGHVIVGWVEDIDVSGGMEPWKRPEFSKWLPSTVGKEVSGVEHRIAYEESRADEYDIICALKLDRLSRRVLHVHTLVEWCHRNGKQVATVEDGIDLATPMGKILFNLIASFAEGELEAIKARAKSSYNHLVKKGRWRGGRIPYGYRPEKQETGEGWTLVPDDYGTDTAGTLREIVRRLIEADSANSVAQWLNEDHSKTPTSVDAQRIRNGQPPKGSRWTAASVSKVVRSRNVLGQMEITEEVSLPNGEKGKRSRVVLDAEGNPLQRAEPLISQEDWELANQKLDQNTTKRSGNRSGGSPLLRVAFCTCGEPLYAAPGHKWPHYRCASRTTHKACPEGNRSIGAAALERLVEEEFLRAAGDIEIVRKVFRPGVDYTRDLEEVNRAIAELREDREAGLYSSETGKQEFRESYQRLDARREQLRSLPTRPDTWEEMPTGVTYRERWASLPSVREKGKELRAAGLRVIVHKEELPEQFVGGSRLVALDKGEVTIPVGRVKIVIPRDFSDRIRQLSVQHSDN